jgi:hypothetical protein
MLLVQGKLCGNSVDQTVMANGLHAINAFLINKSCKTGESCPFPGYEGEIDNDNGRVTSYASMLNQCLAATDNFTTNCPGGGLSISDLEKIAEQQLGLTAAYEKISVAASASNQDRLAWLEQMLNQQMPVIVHVDYKLGVDPNFPVGQAGHYMVLVGLDGTNDSNTVYVVDPGVSLACNGNYSNGTTIISGTCDPPIPYTVKQFLQSWSSLRDPYGVLVLTASSPGCSLASAPLGIVAKSLASLAAGQVTVPYSASIVAQFGSGLYTWSLVPGQGILPPGIQLDPGSGILSGTPTAPGPYTFTVQVTDAGQNVASGVATINIGSVAGTLAITTPGNLQGATSGKPYTFPLSASGGVSPYHWSAGGLVCPNSIPGLDGICIADGGSIQGTPTTATNGAVSFSLQVTDSSIARQSVNKTVNLGVLPASLPPQVYSVTATPSTVVELGTSALTCSASDPQQSTLSYRWVVTGGNISGTGANVTWSAPSKPGGYTVTCTVTSGLGLSNSNSTLIQVSSSVLNSSIIPASGTASVTQFNVSGSGATPTHGVTATITLPNTTTATYHTTANSAGQYSFGPYIESMAGVYSEVDSDDQTAGKSLPFTWTVSPVNVPTVSSIFPTTMVPDGQAHLLNISGNNFQSGNVVQFKYTGTGWQNGLGNPPNITPPGQMSITMYPGTTNDTIYVRVCLSLSQVADANCSSGTQYVTVAATAPVLSVTPMNSPVSAASGSTDFNVSNAGTGMLSYSATVTTGSSWLSIASGATGGNSGTIAMSYSANTGGQRSGTIQVTASGASGSPATVSVTQAGVTTSNIRISENQGFDILLAPSQSEMDAWLASPYRDIGVYIGGCNASVAPPSGMKDSCGSFPAMVSSKPQNSNLTSDWVGHVSNSGWGIMPLWVGPQSSCITQNNNNNLIENTIITTASDLGAAEADAAAARASALGMGNSIVYYDMEAYSTGNTSCSATVGQFLSGWVNEMHVHGFQAGVYGAPYNVKDWTTTPDAVWMFYPDGVNTASDLDNVISGTWAQKRIHQYCAGSAQTCPSPAQQMYGGVTLGGYPNQGIDLDVEDGPVFSTTAVTGTAPTVTSINPTTMTANSTSNPNATQTLTIYGPNFQSGNVVQVQYTGVSWKDANGNPPSIGSGQMTISINPGTITDTIYVRVCRSASQETTSDCSSGTQSIAVTAQVLTPSISSIYPTTMTANGQDQQLTINGSSFQSGDYVQFKWTQGSGAGQWTTSLNTPSITSSVITVMMKPGTVTDTFNVRVCNSANSCAVAAQTIAVTAQVLTPSISSIYPTSMPADGAQHQLTIYGSNFASGNWVQVQYTGSNGWIDSLHNPPSVTPPSQMSINIGTGTTSDKIYVRVCESASQETTSTCSSGAQYITVN